MLFEPNLTVMVCPPDAGDGGPPPVIVFLHGIGERGRGGGDLAAVAQWGLPKHRLAGVPLTTDPFPFLVVAPQCPPENQWSDPAMLDALDSLANRLIADGVADPARFYLSGFSMGGVGTFAWAVRQPDRFAAIAPVCGRCTAPDMIQQLKDLPTWIAYAEDDEIAYLATGSADAAAALTPFGNAVVRPYRLGAADGQRAHVRTADRAYLEPDLYTWMLAHRRDERIA